ncbi:hypothetical protein GUITHDRAFT_108763 [Guillardia theta CCMP2712]|uniref:Cep192-like domain-containing protein n=1 Tax=Guillardia theta (strain CCMP2712) TaxID=905079 RepID=L1JAE4_GUITC|nr:hypothetical protein GUITHDRAFT_108763 [Guillardia theta CCMP2712]EKX45501.1 hypothetical protein GUITHDRAFT_108763 [Guillardia theta CCMP2712]|eukprot:XP_005832481.1 hypothetical protein GUITHDRAFT_108763 [Guillardia theta CCMP2712]
MPYTEEQRLNSILRFTDSKLSNFADQLADDFARSGAVRQRFFPDQSSQSLYHDLPLPSMPEGGSQMNNEMVYSPGPHVGPLPAEQSALDYLMEEKENLAYPMLSHLKMSISNSEQPGSNEWTSIERNKSSKVFPTSDDLNHDLSGNHNHFATPNTQTHKMGLSKTLNGINDWEVRPSPKDLGDFQELLDISNERRRDVSYGERWEADNKSDAVTPHAHDTATKNFRTAAPVMHDEDWYGLNSQLQSLSTRKQQVSNDLSRHHMSQECDVNDLETLESKSLMNDINWIERHFAADLSTGESPERAADRANVRNSTIENKLQNNSTSKTALRWQNSMSMYVKHLGDDESQGEFGKSQSVAVFLSSDMLVDGTKNADNLANSQQESWTNAPFAADVSVQGMTSSHGWKSNYQVDTSPLTNDESAGSTSSQVKFQLGDEKNLVKSSGGLVTNQSGSTRVVQPWTPITPLNFTPRKTELDDSSLKYLMAKWAEKEQKIQHDSSGFEKSSLRRFEEGYVSSTSSEGATKSGGMKRASEAVDDKCCADGSGCTTVKMPQVQNKSPGQSVVSSSVQQRTVETSALSAEGKSQSMVHSESRVSEREPVTDRSERDILTSHEELYLTETSKVPPSRMKSSVSGQGETFREVNSPGFSSRASRDRMSMEEQDEQNSEGTPSIIVSNYQQNGSDSSIILPVEESFDSSSSDAPEENDDDLNHKVDDDDRDSLADSLVDSDGEAVKDEKQVTRIVGAESEGKTSCTHIEPPIAQVEVSSTSLCFSRQHKVKPLSFRNVCEYPILVILRFLQESVSKFSLPQEFLKETTLQPGQSVDMAVKYHPDGSLPSKEETHLAILSIPFHASSSQPSCSWVSIKAEEEEEVNSADKSRVNGGAQRRAEDPQDSHWFVDAMSVDLGMVYCQTAGIFTPPVHQGTSVVNSSGHDVSFLAWLKDKSSPARSTFGISLESCSKAPFRPAGFVLFTVPARQRRPLRISVDTSTYKGPGQETCKATLYLRQVQTAQLEEVASLFSQSQRASDILRGFEDRARCSDVTTVKLRCTLGHCRLQIPKSVKEVYLECEDNQRARRSFALRNSGCFPASVRLSISPESTSSIVVEPRKLHIPAGGQEKVSVLFDPEEASQLKANLQLRIEEDVGVYFNVPVRAHALPARQEKPSSTPPMRDPANERKSAADSAPPCGPSSAHRFSLPRQTSEDSSLFLASSCCERGSSSCDKESVSVGRRERNGASRSPLSIGKLSKAETELSSNVTKVNLSKLNVSESPALPDVQSAIKALKQFASQMELYSSGQKSRRQTTTRTSAQSSERRRDLEQEVEVEVEQEDSCRVLPYSTAREEAALPQRTSTRSGGPIISLSEHPVKVGEPASGKRYTWLNFPNTPVGEASVVRLALCNRSGKPAHLEISGGRGGNFLIKSVNVDIRPGAGKEARVGDGDDADELVVSEHYLMLPVYFTPKAPGKAREKLYIACRDVAFRRKLVLAGEGF